MQIIIVGCGKVGLTLAEQLTNEGHNLVLVDLDSKKIQEAVENYDVMGIVGNGSSFTVLSEANVDQADLLIAVTGSDELNLLCCLIAKKTGHCQTIARVRNPLYNKEISFIKEQLGISMILTPELAAATEITSILRFPTANKIHRFAKGKVELVKFRVRPEFKLHDFRVADIISRMKYDVLVCAVERGDHVYIPNGDFVLQTNDLVSIMATPQNSMGLFNRIGVKTNQVKNCMIVGGGTIGFYLAKRLTEMNIKVHLIESSKERCEELTELLPEATIIHGDATDKQLLLEEGLEQAESFVCLTNLDEENLFLALYAKKHSSAKLIAKVNRITFDDIIDDLDIDSIIYPKYITADHITRYVRAMQNTIGSNVETLYRILDNRAEALEFIVREESAVTNIPLSELNTKDNLLISCIMRNGTIRIPRGQDSIQVGDTVVVVTTAKGLNDIRDIVKK